MNKKPTRPRSKKKASTKKSRFAAELTRRDLFVWLGVVFLAMVWMFTLGIIVGRGLSPVRFDVEKLKKELIALKHEVLKREEADRKTNAKILSRKDSLDFYDLLTDKKERARLKPSSKVLRKPVKRTQAAKNHKKPESKPMPLVEAKKRASQDVKHPAAQKRPSSGSFTVQVLSIKDSERASEVVSVLKSKGYSAYKVAANVPGKGTYHRVRVGHFEDHGEAKRVAARLGRGEKLEPIVIRE